ncbi:MAG: NADH-quinone oxidoreductase subunit I [Candidatus Methylacidiphilales bacterium]|nr:NADH-quinone oxidoreductase subunit I [Candidatus Methylacidiphilales bacterium]
MYVTRPELSWYERLYLPAIVGGLLITLKHLRRTAAQLAGFGHRQGPRSLMDMPESGMVTMQYPEEQWPMPEGYRGAPALVKDEEGREKCVSCQLCEFVCPPRAIRIIPGEIPLGSVHAKVEKAPKEFDIDMLRCIYCGLCEEVCPEEAIFLQRRFPIKVGYDRESMVNNKARLYEMGGELNRPIKKWAGK